MTPESTRHPSANLFATLTNEAYASDYPPKAEQTHISPKWWASSVVVSAVVTLVITAALTSTNLLAPSQRSQQAELASRVEQLRESVRRTTTNNDQERARLKSLAASQLTQSKQGRTLLAQLSAAEVAAGVTAVSDSGVCITIEQRSRNSGQISDRDMQRLVNELWRRGATAMSINGYRLTSRTAIRTAGNAILVSYRPIDWPYQVCVVGSAASTSTLSRPALAGVLTKFDLAHGVKSQVRALWVVAPAARVD